MTDRVAAALTDARRKVDDAKASADRWSLRLALAASGLAALAALGQVFLFRASRRARFAPLLNPNRNPVLTR